ncbi:MAG: hypothetical protein Fur005_22170 [Roseiflexaceae bacterium]
MAYQLLGDRRTEGFALSALATIDLEQGQIAQAHAGYREAVEAYQTVGLLESVYASIAGLATVALASGDVAEALLHIEPILQYLANEPFKAVDEPIRISLICVKVLAAAADPRAQPMLEQAYWELIERARQIADPQGREDFLNLIPVHHEVIAR